MLVLTRRPGESIYIGEDIKVVAVKYKSGHISIGIDAPRDLVILREEVRDYNIRVINIIPGATETPIWTNEMREEKGEKMMKPNSVARLMVSAFLQADNLVTEEIIVRPVQGDI